MIFSNILIFLTFLFAVEEACSYAIVSQSGIELAQSATPPADYISPEDAMEVLQETQDLLDEAQKNLKIRGEKPSLLDPLTLPTDNKTEVNIHKIAVLKGLNKITARTSSINVSKGTKTTFGNLEIKLHECWKSVPSERAEAKALVEIWEKEPFEPASDDMIYVGKNTIKRIFFGWMFASSPAVSSLEHPVYDITVQDCRG